MIRNDGQGMHTGEVSLPSPWAHDIHAGAYLNPTPLHIAVLRTRDRVPSSRAVRCEICGGDGDGDGGGCDDDGGGRGDDGSDVDGSDSDSGGGKGGSCGRSNRDSDTGSLLAPGLPRGAGAPGDIGGKDISSSAEDNILIHVFP